MGETVLFIGSEAEESAVSASQYQMLMGETFLVIGSEAEESAASPYRYQMPVRTPFFMNTLTVHYGECKCHQRIVIPARNPDFLRNRAEIPACRGSSIRVSEQARIMT
jgi:hypothetical protein